MNTLNDIVDLIDDILIINYRKIHLEFIRMVYPRKAIEDKPDSAGLVLDYVEKGIIRIEDPRSTKGKINVLPGIYWEESEELRQKVIEACEIFSKYRMEDYL